MTFNEPVVCIQIGQCGNQLGFEFFNRLTAELSRSSEHGSTGLSGQVDAFNSFFREPSATNSSSTNASGSKAIARSVLVDMEPKVIRSIVDKTDKNSSWTYDTSNSILHQSGSGNNWMHGYAEHGPSVEPFVLNSLRKEAEACDVFRSVMSFQSLAGGTGSGLGTFIMESVREQYPKISMLNNVVWPYKDGEVVVQSLNAALSASHLLNTTDGSDGLIILQNDIASRAISRSTRKESPSLTEINQYLAQEVLSCIFPSMAEPRPGSMPTKSSVDTGTNPSIRFSSLVSHLFSNPLYKLSLISRVPTVSTDSQAFESTTWKYIRTHLLGQHLTQSFVSSIIDWNVGVRRSSNFDLQRTPITSRVPASQDLFPVALTFEEENQWSGFSNAKIKGLELYQTKVATLLEKYQHDHGELIVDPRYYRSYSGIVTYRGRDANLQLKTSESRELQKPPAKQRIPNRRGAEKQDLTSMEQLGFHHPSLWSNHSLNPLLETFSNVALFGDERVGSIWSTSQKIIEPLNHVISSAWELYSQGAFLHHYEKYGLEVSDLESHFMTLEYILAAYKNM